MSIETLDEIVSNGFIVEQGSDIPGAYYLEPANVGGDVLGWSLPDICQGGQGLLLPCYWSELLENAACSWRQVWKLPVALDRYQA